MAVKLFTLVLMCIMWGSCGWYAYFYSRNTKVRGVTMSVRSTHSE